MIHVEEGLTPTIGDIKAALDDLRPIGVDVRKIYTQKQMAKWFPGYDETDSHFREDIFQLQLSLTI